MKNILEWLEEAKQQGYEWAEAAIKNYDPTFAEISDTESLKDAVCNAFNWQKSPEKDEYWSKIAGKIWVGASAAPATLHELALLYDNISESLSNLKTDLSLREPYRTAAFEAYKANYEAELAELTEKIAERLGMGGLRSEVSRLSQALSDATWQIEQAKEEYKEYKEASDTTIRNLDKELSTLKKDLDRQVSHTQGLEKELVDSKSKNLKGWISADADGNIFYFRKPTKFGVQWQGIRLISKDDAIYLCDRVPEWSDDEPTPIYK